MSHIVKNEDQQMVTDQTLVAACQRGDSEAFEGLVLRHQHLAFNVALRICGNEHDAADTVQDAFIAAWRKIGDYRGEAQFSTWLIAIVVNVARSRIKQRNVNELRMTHSLDAPPSNSSGELPPEPACTAASALAQLEEAELRQMVQRCISALDHGFREVLVLRDMQELSYEEVGTALQLREGTVKSRLYRARDAIKECLKKVLDKP
jgi:RNA polymerase sigma-70 factor (ECF subfamily)